jgi:hypothetical protein
MDERSEGEFRGAMTMLADKVGPDAYNDMVLKIGLAQEDYLRKNAKPDNPMLVMLDAHHARQERGFDL